MIQATKGAFKLRKVQPTHRFVLVVLAFYANEQALTWPSIARVVDDTGLNHKTVSAAMKALKDAQFILDTGKRTGPTKRVSVYQISSLVLDAANGDEAPKTYLGDANLGEDIDLNNDLGDTDLSDLQESNVSRKGNISASNVATSSKVEGDDSENGRVISPFLSSLRTTDLQSTYKGKDYKKAESKPKPPKLTPLPDGWKPNNDDIQFAVDRGVPWETEHQSFTDHHLAKGSLFADWRAAWRTWIGNAVKFGRGGKNLNSVPGGLFASETPATVAAQSTFAQPAFGGYDGKPFASQEHLDAIRLSSAEDVWNYVAVAHDFDDEDGAKRRWCEENRAKVVRLSPWAAETVLGSYQEFADIMNQLHQTSSGVGRGEDRVKMIETEVRQRWNQMKRAEAERAALRKALESG